MNDRRNAGIGLTRPWNIGIVLVSVVVMIVALVWWLDRPLVQAEGLLQDGSPAEALERLDAFLARRPAHQRALLLKARTLVALQRWQEATEVFELTGAGTPDELRANKWVQASNLGKLV